MDPDVSVVVPAYNEADRLAGTLPRLIALVDDGSTEVIVVDDGSVDATAEIVTAAFGSHPRLHVLRLERNRGKGAAVRAGVLAATGHSIVFMDADLATELTHLSLLLRTLDRADVVVGSRAVDGSRVIDAAASRALMGRVFNAMTRRLTGIPVRDTQCGFKAFRADAARTVFSLSSVDGFAFDVEVLTLAKRLGLEVEEVPVTWRSVPGTKVRPAVDSVKMMRDLIRIAVRWRPSAVARSVRLLNREKGTGSSRIGVTTGIAADG